MRVLRSARWLVLALLVFLIPAKSHAGVFISVGFAPPVLPVYVQPPCPQPGLMWTPGYWAYGPEGYYWVPGTWVPAPYAGALWTPPYWGWSGGLYVFHPGYWGAHVGYYGGVNYGFGYMGIGFVGGMWHGGVFAYNTAVVHVNETVVRNVYVDRTIVEHNTIINNTRVSYNGGPGGIQHQATAQEQIAMHDSHMAPTSFQQQHIQAAQADRAAYFNANHGRPQNVAAARPLQAESHSAPAGVNANARGNYNAQGSRPAYQAQHPAQSYGSQSHPAYQSETRPAQQPRYEQPQSRPESQQRAESQQRPESHPQSHQEHESESKPREPHR